MSFKTKNWPWDEAQYELTEHLIWDSEKEDRNFIADDDWLEISCGEWRIKKGFQWNGTTAVPDGKPHPNPETLPIKSLKGHKIPITWKASLVHDIGCKYVYEKDFPYTRKEVDQIFYGLLKEINFKQATLYYVGVRGFSIFFAKWFWKFGMKI